MKNTQEFSPELKKELIIKICSESCTPQDEKIISEISLQDIVFAKQIEELKKAQQICDDIDFIESIDLDSEYANVKKRVKIKRERSILVAIQRYAAMLAIPLLITTFILCYIQFFTGGEKDNRLVEVIVPHGAILNYELPDKSVVCLNSGSKLSYPIKFEKAKREVYIDGEGFFTVTADKKNPFYVHTEYGISTYVYGTQFNVNAYKTDNYVETTLIEGKLDLVDVNYKTQAILNPGQAISYNPESRELDIKQADIEEKVGWRSGELIFRDTPFSELIRKLERRFNVVLDVIGDVSDDITIRATFDVETLEQILDYLSLSVNMSWRYAKVDHSKPKTIKHIEIQVYK